MLLCGFSPLAAKPALALPLCKPGRTTELSNGAASPRTAIKQILFRYF